MRVCVGVIKSACDEEILLSELFTSCMSISAHTMYLYEREGPLLQLTRHVDEASTYIQGDECQQIDDEGC